MKNARLFVSMVTAVIAMISPYQATAESPFEPRKTFSDDCYPEDALLCAIGKHDNKRVDELLKRSASAVTMGFKRGYKGDRPEWLKDFHRQTYPLQFAVQYGNFYAVDRLLGHGANPNGEVSSENEFTPLADAASLGELGIVQLLLAHGADPNRRSRTSPDAYPPILMAVDGPDGDRIEGPRSSEIQIRIVEALLEAGANVNATANKVDALDRAAYVGDRELLWYLLSTGAKPACFQEDFEHFNTDWTLLQWSVRSRDPQMVQTVAGLPPPYCIGSAKGGLLMVRDEAKDATTYKDNYQMVMQRLGRIKLIIGKIKPPRQN